MDETRPNETFLPHTNARFLKTFDELLRTIPPTPHLHYFVAQSSWKIIMDHLARTRNCSHRHCRAPYVGVTRDHNQNQSYVVPMHPLPGCGKKKPTLRFPELFRERWGKVSVARGLHSFPSALRRRRGHVYKRETFARSPFLNRKIYKVIKLKLISSSQIINWNKWIEMEIEEIDLIEKLIGIVRDTWILWNCFRFKTLVILWQLKSLIVKYTWVLADWEISYARNRCWDRRLYLDYSNESRRMCCIH